MKYQTQQKWNQTIRDQRFLDSSVEFDQRYEESQSSFYLRSAIFDFNLESQMQQPKHFDSNWQQNEPSKEKGSQQSILVGSVYLPKNQLSKNISKVNRRHLHNKRNRGNKNSIQKRVKGFWTKNFQQFGKTYHFHYIQQKKCSKLFHLHPQLKTIKHKKGITLQDYQFLYQVPELEQVWKQFFEKKVLYRALMLSRTLSSYRVVYAHFIEAFEIAYKTKKFDGLNSLMLKAKSPKKQ